MADEVLQPYLECPDEQDAEVLLAGLLFEQAEPLVRRVLARRLDGAVCPQDREDLSGDVMVELLVRLRKQRSAPQENPIACFRAYAAAAAQHACDGFFRRRAPQRHRLKNRLRYVLREDPRFALWTDENGTMVCGLAAKKGTRAGELRAAGDVIAADAPLESALERLFEATADPLELDDVVGFLAQALGIRDAMAPIESVRERPGHTADPAAALDNRRRLQLLWSGILMLPAPQRAALLLHLQDDRGGPLLALLPVSGVASIQQIAAALEMSALELAELWNRLPLQDSAIAPRLEVTRQQVINLRSTARQRLARMVGMVRGKKESL